MSDHLPVIIFKGTIQFITGPTEDLRPVRFG